MPQPEPNRVKEITARLERAFQELVESLAKPESDSPPARARRTRLAGRRRSTLTASGKNRVFGFQF